MKPNGAVATRQLVLAEAGAVLLALPVETVAGAVPWPAPEHGQAARLPRRGGAVCGVLDHFGAAIALLDLSLWVDIGRPREQAPAYRRALILQHRGRRVAIGVDQVRGLQTLPATAIERLVHDDDPAQIFHSTVRCAGDGDDGLASLLDVERLMALAHTWSEPAADAAIDAQADAAVVATAPLQPCGVLAGRDCRIAFAIADLAEVVPAPPLLAFPTALTEGLCLWRARQLPVTSLARCFPALALPPLPASPGPALMAVFQHQGMALGMLIDEVPAIVALPVAVSAQAQASSVHCALDGTLIHLVDSAGLFARFPEAAVSREHATSAQSTQGIHADAATNEGAHLVYEAAGCAATPLAGIEAVLKLPPLEPQATHMSWRGGALALRDLRSGAGADGTVIVIRDAMPPAGVIVDAVKTLVQARSTRLARLRVAGRGDTTLLTTGTGAGQETYAVRHLSAASSAAEAASPGAASNP